MLIAATIRGIAPVDVESEDVRLHRRARRLARLAVATVVVLALVASLAAVVAVAKAHEAERRARDPLAVSWGWRPWNCPLGRSTRPSCGRSPAPDLTAAATPNGSGPAEH